MCMFIQEFWLAVSYYFSDEDECSDENGDENDGGVELEVVIHNNTPISSPIHTSPLRSPSPDNSISSFSSWEDTTDLP